MVLTFDEIIQKVAEDVDLPVSVVKKTYTSYWRFIRNSIKELPLPESLSEEEFSKLSTNFNIPSLGKLTCTYNRYLGMKERTKIIEKLREKDKQNGISNKES